MMNEPTAHRENKLLQRMTPSARELLRPHLRRISVESGRVLYEAQGEIEYAYFPINCVLSAVTLMKNGSAIEVGMVGFEGVAGVTAFLGCPAVSPHRVLAQVPGEAYRIEADLLERLGRENAKLQDLLLQHHCAFLSQVSQSAACNGLHPILKRCARWLLMTDDRAAGNELPLTHEFLSYMLGVRRPGVTEALQTLQEQGLVANRRGAITIVNRDGLEQVACECYRTVAKEYARLLGDD